MITGYSDSVFTVCGPGAPDSADPWSSLGDSEFGWVEVFAVTAGKPVPDRQIVKEALQFALAVSQNPNPWALPDCKMGPEAYELWAASLETKKVSWFGNAFNAAAWAECRGHAVDFLAAAKTRLKDVPRERFDEAIHHYTIERVPGS